MRLLDPAGAIVVCDNGANTRALIFPSIGQIFWRKHLCLLQSNTHTSLLVYDHVLSAFVPSSPGWRHCRTRQWRQHRRANLPENRPAFLAKASLSVKLQGPLHRFPIPSLACAVEFRVYSCARLSHTTPCS
jgi:hypothetical protein